MSFSLVISVCGEGSGTPLRPSYWKMLGRRTYSGWKSHEIVKIKFTMTWLLSFTLTHGKFLASQSFCLENPKTEELVVTICKRLQRNWFDWSITLTTSCPVLLICLNGLQYLIVWVWKIFSLTIIISSLCNLEESVFALFVHLF